MKFMLQQRKGCGSQALCSEHDVGAGRMPRPSRGRAAHQAHQETSTQPQMMVAGPP